MNTTRKIYSLEDFNSRDGMLTTVWGPGMWHFLHTMSFNYPVHPTEKDKIHYRDFVINLKYTLPCGKCRKNLVKNFQKLPLTTINVFQLSMMPVGYVLSLKIFKERPSTLEVVSFCTGFAGFALFIYEHNK